MMSEGYRSNLVDIACEVLHQTEGAILIDDGAAKTWLPKSLTQVNDDGTVTLPEWLAQEKGLI